MLKSLATAAALGPFFVFWREGGIDRLSHQPEGYAAKDPACVQRIANKYRPLPFLLVRFAGSVRTAFRRLNSLYNSGSMWGCRDTIYWVWSSCFVMLGRISNGFRFSCS